MKAILNGELIELNELTAEQVKLVAESQKSKYKGKWYFNPDGATISPNANESEFKDVAERKSALAKKTFSKLAIRRAMRKLGQENVLDGLLSENVEFGKDWNDADEGIDLSDKAVIQAIQATSINVDKIKLAIAGIAD